VGVVGARAYDLLYRFRAPWEQGPRSELVELVESGILSPQSLPPGRAIDLGCGSGANAVYLAERGFHVTGVDFSRVALAKARRLAESRHVERRVVLVRGDLTRAAIPGVLGPFDLLIDYGTLDDLRAVKRRAMATTIQRLSRGGSRFLFWCFYGMKSELPWMSFTGPSRLAPGLEPGEEEALFGDAFDIERLPKPPRDSRAACFLMTRR
jgi:SAM-dependent methyltransferase